MNINAYVDPSSMTMKQLAKMENNTTFMNVFNRFLNDAMGRYYFTGLPSTVSHRVLVSSILWNGCAFPFMKNGSMFALGGMPDGSGINIYGDFAGAYVYGKNGYNEHIKLVIPGGGESATIDKTINKVEGSDSLGVMLRANAQCYPFINTVFYYAKLVSDSMRALDICRKNAKRPYIVIAEESAINTVKQFFKNVDNNEQYVISSGVFPADRVNIQNLDSNPQYITSLTGLIDWYEQKYREACGFENMGASIDKKGENLIQAETEFNDQYTHSQVQHEIDSIKEGLDVWNYTFGYNIGIEPACHINMREDGDKDADVQRVH